MAKTLLAPFLLERRNGVVSDLLEPTGQVQSSGPPYQGRVLSCTYL